MNPADLIMGALYGTVGTLAMMTVLNGTMSDELAECQSTVQRMHAEAYMEQYRAPLGHPLITSRELSDE